MEIPTDDDLKDYIESALKQTQQYGNANIVVLGSLNLEALKQTQQYGNFQIYS